MKKLTLAPYEKRLSRRLPPIRISEIDYLKRKYCHLIWVLFREMKTNYNMWRQTEDDLCNIIFRALHSFGGRAELKSIYLFEKWMVSYVSEGLKKTNKESSIDDGSLTRILTGGRICRTRIFDDFSCKYFPILENKLSSLSVVNPSKVIAIAIDEAEDWHIDFDEDEQDFFWDVAMNLKFFCRVYQQKEIDIDFLEEGLEF